MNDIIAIALIFILRIGLPIGGSILIIWALTNYNGYKKGKKK
jgi:hypothetical protein